MTRLATVLIVPFAAASIGFAQVNPITFAAHADFVVGASPLGITTGDFNRDGSPDIATANSDSDTVSVLLGTGTGSFQTARTFAAHFAPSAIASADIDADGFADLMVTNEISSDVSVLLGNGDGSFRAATNSAVGKTPGALTVANLNGDSHLDVATADVFGNTISVLLGNGDGTFQPARAFPVAGRPIAIAAGDFNHDGVVDLAASANEADVIVVLLGHGDGAFGSAMTYAVGPSPAGLVIRDLNGDGNADIAVTSEDADSVFVLLGTGDGTFQPAQSYAVGAFPEAVTLSDLNHDGILDLLTADGLGASPLTSSVSVLRGHAGGTFSAAQSFEVGASPLAVALADFDGDGLPDAVTANADANDVSILLSNSAPPTPTATRTPTATPTVTATRTWTPTVLPTFTPTRTSTATPSSTLTYTAVPTSTPSKTATSTPSSTSTLTRTFTATPSATPTNTPTTTPTQTATKTLMITPTPTPSPTSTPTWTPTRTAHPTSWPSPTPSPTPTVTCACVVDLIADKLEVVQSVQDLNNSVPLVANKRTFVRFHVHSTSGEYETTARLSVKRGDQQALLSPQNPGGTIMVQPAPNRAALDHAFLFALPSEFEAGTVQLTGELNPDGNPSESNTGNNSLPYTAHFEEVPEQRLVLYSVGYEQGGQLHSPQDMDRTQMALWLQRAFPLSDLQVTERSYFAGSEVPTCGEVNAYLLSKRLWDLAFNTDVPANTRYYGMVDDAGGFMPGCAVSVPGFVASGPTGSPGQIFSWDTDGSYGDWYGGHELAHAWGRPDAPFCGATGSPYGNPDGRISPALSGNAAIFGFDTFTRAIYEPSWKDVMSFCDYAWVSDVTYQGLLDFFQSETVTIGRDVNRTDRLLVVGTIDPTTDAVALQPLFMLLDTGELKQRVPGNYTIVLRNSAGTVLQRYPFTPDTGAGGDPERNVSALFINELVPYVAGTARVDIEHAGIVRETVTAGIAAPTIQIVSASGGSAAAVGETVTLSWEADDADGDPLRFDVQYSPDNGATWETIAQNLGDTSVTIDLRNLTRSEQALFRVAVTDGIHTSESAPSAPFRIPNRTPTVRITFPASDLWTLANGTLPLQAEVADPDGPTPKNNIGWYASSDQTLGTLLGTSAALTVPTCETGCPLGLGEHTITVQVIDGEFTRSDHVAVTVVKDDAIVKCNTNPTAECPNQIRVDPTAITCVPGGEQTLTIDNGNRSRSDVIDWTARRHAGWMHLQPAQGSTCGEDECTGRTPASVTVRCSAEGLLSAPHSSIDVTSPDTLGQSQRVEVQLVCTGDCNADGHVTVDELVKGVNIALGTEALSDCPQFDKSGDRKVTVDELVVGVNNALNGCSG